MPRLLLPLAVLLAAAPAFAQSDLAGAWSGALDVGGTQPTLIFHFVPSDGGAYTATMDVPQQGAYSLPADSVASTGDSLVVAFAALNATFAGAVADTSIAGTWAQGGRVFSLTLTPYEMPVDEAPKAGPKASPGDFSGDWTGALALPNGGEVRLALHLTRTDGGYEAALTGPGGESQPVAARIEGHTMTLSSTTPALEVVGTVSEDEQTIEGEWHQGGQKLPITFTRR